MTCITDAGPLSPTASPLSGAVTISLHGYADRADVDLAARRGPSAMLRSGATVVLLTGVLQPQDIQLSDGTLPIPLSGLGSITLVDGDVSAGQGTLPFAMTASGLIRNAVWPSGLTGEDLANRSIPVILQPGRDLPVELQEANGKIIFSAVDEKCLDSVAFTIVGTGNLAPLDKEELAELADNRCYEAEEGLNSKRPDAIAFLETLSSEGMELHSLGLDGCVTVRNGSSSVLFLTGGVPVSTLALTDGTLPFPIAGEAMPLPFVSKSSTITINPGDGTTSSESMIPFALKSQGGLVVPKDWLVDNAVPRSLANTLSKATINVAIQSGLTLPRGLKGTGKLAILDPLDGTNPWPSIPKDMLPYVLTGEGTIDLTDGTWPLPRMRPQDRSIPAGRVEGTIVLADGTWPLPRMRPQDRSILVGRVEGNPFITSEPVHPDDRDPVVPPKGTKACPDPVNPDDLPPIGILPLGPSVVGPDPVNPEGKELGN